MKQLSRPLVYTLLAVIVFVAFYWTQNSDADAAKPAPKKVAAKKTAEDEDPAQNDTSVKFDPPDGALRDIFMPKIKPETRETAKAAELLMKVPSDLAGGEGDWCFTGVAEVDGAMSALFENGAAHHSEFVKQGQSWKKCRIASVNVDNVVLIGEDRVPVKIYRYNAAVAAKQKAASDNGAPSAQSGEQAVAKGAPPPMQGQIGDIQVVPDSGPISVQVGSKG